MCEKAVKLILPDEVKNELLSLDLYQYAYVVDVRAETIEDKPVLYNILKLHDKIKLESQ